MSCCRVISPLLPHHDVLSIPHKDPVLLQLLQHTLLAHEDDKDQDTTAEVEEVQDSEENLRSRVAKTGVLMVRMDKVVETLEDPSKTKDAGHSRVQDLSSEE